MFQVKGHPIDHFRCISFCFAVQCEMVFQPIGFLLQLPLVAPGTERPQHTAAVSSFHLESGWFLKHLHHFCLIHLPQTAMNKQHIASPATHQPNALPLQALYAPQSPLTLTMSRVPPSL